MGGGGKGSSNNTDTSAQLGQLAQTLFNETSPIRSELLGQGLEALRTGGIGAQIPMISRAIESSKSQLSQDLTGMQESLASTRLVGTPFAQHILGQGRIAGNQGIANIPTNYAQNFISQLPSFVSSLTGQGVSGMGSAAGAAAQTQASMNAANAQQTSTMIQGATSAAMLAAMMF